MAGVHRLNSTLKIPSLTHLHTLSVVCKPKKKKGLVLCPLFFFFGLLMYVDTLQCACYSASFCFYRECERAGGVSMQVYVLWSNAVFVASMCLMRLLVGEKEGEGEEIHAQSLLDSSHISKLIATQLHLQLSILKKRRTSISSAFSFLFFLLIPRLFFRFPASHLLIPRLSSHVHPLRLSLPPLSLSSSAFFLFDFTFLTSIQISFRFLHITPCLPQSLPQASISLPVVVRTPRLPPL